MGKVLDALRSDHRCAEWLARLEEAGGADAPPVLPAADDLPEVLVDLAVPHEDVGGVVAARAAVAGDPDLWWLLERSVAALARAMGEPGTGVRPCPLPDSLGPAGRYFHVLAYASALPYVRAYHRQRGIGPEVTRRTLTDLGRHMAVHRRKYGTGGLHAPQWVALHFRGELYQLGRLQFQRGRLGEKTGRRAAGAGLAAGPGAPHLELHIPDYLGPMTPEACDASLERAREFFPRHFPQERPAVAVCHSWLLDPQLARYLPPESNIIRFQRRFRDLHQSGDPDNGVPFSFVFGQTEPDLDALPRRTAVQRVLADHVRAGGQWYTGSGWFPL